MIPYEWATNTTPAPTHEERYHVRLRGHLLTPRMPGAPYVVTLGRWLMAVYNPSPVLTDHGIRSWFVEVPWFRDRELKRMLRRVGGATA